MGLQVKLHIRRSHKPQGISPLRERSLNNLPKTKEIKIVQDHLEAYLRQRVPAEEQAIKINWKIPYDCFPASRIISIRSITGGWL